MSTMVQHFKDAMALLIIAPRILKGHYHGKLFGNGDFISHEDIKQANCFCPAGALYRVINVKVEYNWLPIEYVNALGFKAEGEIYLWNWNATKDEVLTRFAETINKLESV